MTTESIPTDHRDRLARLSYGMETKSRFEILLRMCSENTAKIAMCCIIAKKYQ